MCNASIRRPLRVAAIGCTVVTRSLPALLALTAAGCSYVTVAPDGTRRVTGFVHLTLPAQATAAERLRIQIVGAALVHTPFETQLTVGFSDATLTAVKPNSCAAFGGDPDKVDPPAPAPAHPL